MKITYDSCEFTLGTADSTPASIFQDLNDWISAGGTLSLRGGEAQDIAWKPAETTWGDVVDMWGLTPDVAAAYPRETRMRYVIEGIEAREEGETLRLSLERVIEEKQA